MAFLSLGDLTGKAQNAFKRFPIVLIWVIIGTLFTISTVDLPRDVQTDNYTNIILTFTLGVSWLIGTQFFLEQHKNPKKMVWAKPLLLLLLFLFYWHLPEVDIFSDNHIYLVRFFLLLIAGHLFVFFAPFLFKWNKHAYWNYLKSIGFAILRSGFFSGVLYLGLVLALLAIDALFDIRVGGDLYFQLFLFCLGVVNTWIYISDFPKKIHHQQQIQFNKALEVFVKYILIPLVILYLIILYAYSFKILVQWELPKGWVSYLVTALAFLGFIVQVIVNPIQRTVKAWTINRFYPWFYALMLPLLILLFIAIFRRVTDYGFTENRYFVMLLAFWILAMTLYLLFSHKKSLIILPLSLFVLSILASFGFWSASSVSIKSQTKQFQKIYEQVVQNNKVATSGEYRQLRSILDYLDDRKSVNNLNAVTGIDIKVSYRLLDSLGITNAPYENTNNLRNDNFFNYYANRQSAQNYDLDDYQRLAIFSINRYDQNKIAIGSYHVRFDPENSLLHLDSGNDSARIAELQLRPKLFALSQKSTNPYDLDPKEMVIEVENDSISAKIIFEELDFYKKQDSLRLNHARILLFFNKK